MRLNRKPIGRRWSGVVGAVALAVAWVGVRVGARGYDPKTEWPRIQAAFEEKRWQDAEARLIAWLERAPDDGAAWIKLGGLRGIQGRDAEALAAFRRIRPGAREWAQARTLIGEIWFRRRKAAEAEEAFRDAARADPRTVEPRARLVYLLSLEDRPDEAREVLWELYHLDLAPKHLIALAGLAGVEADADTRSLEPDLDRFLRQSPNDVWLRRARGLLSLRQGRPALALPHLEAAAGLEDDPIGRFARAECLIALGRPGAIDDVLGPCPVAAKERGRWRLLKGEAAEARGDAEESVRDLREAVAADPNNRAAHYRLGLALTRRGEADAARPHLERAAKIERDQSRLETSLMQATQKVATAELFEEIGAACLACGLPAEARAWYEQTIMIDPTRPSAQSALFRLAGVKEPSGASGVVRRRRRVAAARGAPADVAPAIAPAPPPRRGGARFRDVSVAAGLTYQYEAGASETKFIAETMGGGVGMIDFDDDGRLDLYLVNGCKLPFDRADPPAPNRLYRNRGDGTFEDVTARAGVGGRGYGMGCVVGDVDNDGDDDLFVTGLTETVLYRNRGDGTFEDVTRRAGVLSTRWSTAAGFGDLDGDGDLDLVVVTYVGADPDEPAQVCLDASGRRQHCAPGKYRAGFDQLFRNNGDGTFTDVSRASGFEAASGMGLGTAVADFDGDGKLDVFVANDSLPNFLFRNLGGLRFEEVGAASGLAYDGNGQTTASMGVVAEDLDGDRRIDVFHTNFLNEPDTLARNLGGGQFQDVTARAGLDAPSRTVTGFGTVALDADNDGRLDLFVANGHVDDQPWFERPMAQLPYFYESVADGRFELADAAAVGPYFARPVVGRGAAAGDFDNDGRVDLAVVHRDAPLALLRNTSESGHFLGVRLRGGASGSTPVGARVACRVGERTSVRWVVSGAGYLSANDPRLWFGLAGARRVDALEIVWPSGLVQSWRDVEGDQILDVREGSDPVAARAGR